MPLARIGSVSALSLLALALELSAQEASVRAGDRVRLTAPGIATSPLVGTLLRVDTDGWLLDAERQPETVAVLRSAATRLELSLGKTSKPLEGAGIGALVGAAAGGLFFGLGCNAADCAPASTLTLATAAGGAILGLALGLAFRVDRWQVIPLGGPSSSRRHNGPGAESQPHLLVAPCHERGRARDTASARSIWCLAAYAEAANAR